MSWLPVDVAARCLLDILFQPAAILPGHGDILHLENPVRQPMHDFGVIASRELGLDCIHNSVSYDEWRGRVEKAGCILSLEDFFRNDFLPMASGELILDTQRSREVSRTLRGVTGVGKELIVDYINRWKEAGFLK